MEHGIIYWIIIGLVAGALAKAIHPGKDPGGWIITIIIGIIGSIIGGFLNNNVIHLFGNNSLIGNVVVATLGAIIFLWLYRMATRGRTTA